MKTTKEINKILEKEQEKMLKYLQWYEQQPGNFSGKIRINRQYAQKIREELQKSPQPYPTKLDYILEIDPTEYNQNSPQAVMYENYKMKAYSILYINTRKEKNWYDEDNGFAIGLELILKEFVDNHPEWTKLLKK
ncbi:MAG: hypothetical protein IJI98_11475 [Methanosphaera sp.]|nr:hypothetical protein [Methanosphaera sp.]